MSRLHQFLIALILTHPAFAADYEGFVFRTKTKISIIESKSKKKFTLKFRSPEAEDQIRNLTTDDYISFEGVRSLTDSVIRIDSVNYVGLKVLLGKWSGSDQFCYDFSGFTSLTIFPREGNRCDFAKKERRYERQLSYTANPIANGWILLISDEAGTYAADIAVKSSKRIDLSLYDSESGAILGQIDLKK